MWVTVENQPAAFYSSHFELSAFPLCRGRSGLCHDVVIDRKYPMKDGKMKHASMKLMVVLLGLLPSTVCGQVQLQLKYPDGRAERSLSEINTKQTLTLAGMDIETASKQNFELLSTNGARNSDGELVTTQKIESMKAELNISGQQLTFDSAKPDAPPPGTALDGLLDVFKALSKSEWTVTRGKDNRVSSVDGRAEALKSLPDAMRTAMEKQLESSYLAEVANDEMAAIPNDAVSVGDTWTHQTTLRLEAGQTFEFDKTYKYEGVVEKDGKSLHKISEQTTDVDYDMEANDASPLKYVSSDLTIAGSEGEILFDNETGLVVSRIAKVHITGPIVFQAGGTDLPSTVDLTIGQSTATSILSP